VCEVNGGASGSCLGMDNVPASARVEGFTFTNENATDGGGIHCSSAFSPTITGNTISGNTAISGGGIYCFDNSSPAISNTIVAFSGGGEGIYDAGTGTPMVTYCDFHGNADGNYGNFTPTGSGNISQDPLFADAANGDFHLESTGGRYDGTQWVRDNVQSPCVDAGNPASSYGAEALPNGGRVNMGRWGNTNQASMPATRAPPLVPGRLVHGDMAMEWLEVGGREGRCGEEYGEAIAGCPAM